MNKIRTLLSLAAAGMLLLPAMPAAGQAADDAAVQIPTNTLRNIGEIKQLSMGEAGRAYHALVEGQVLYIDRGDTPFMFIHDGQVGMYIQLTVWSELPEIHVGDWVRVEGYTQAGGFSPIIMEHYVTVTGWAPLPKPKPYDRTMQQSPSIDVEWVAIYGRPIAMELAGDYGYVVVTMEVMDTQSDLFVPYGEQVFDRLAPFMFREVYVQAIMGTTANAHLQMTGRIFYVDGPDAFMLLDSVAEHPATPVPIHELLSYGKDLEGLIRIEGTVLHTAPGTLYVRGEQNSLKALLAGDSHCKPGDVVELTGYAKAQPISPSFWTVSLKKIASGPPPAPTPILIDGIELMDPDWNNDFVSLEADYVYTGKAFIPSSMDSADGLHPKSAQETLWCQAGNQLIEARLPDGVLPKPNLRPGSRVRLQGICQLTKSKDPRLERMIESLWIELADGDAVTIIDLASWWTTRRLLWGLGIALFACSLSLAWIGALHRTVERQTDTIGQQIKRETTLNERQRIARELHDTLEQGLTALSIQLRRIGRKVQSDPVATLDTIEMAESMLRVCREESRASIQDLRGGILEKMDLPNAIEHLLAPRMTESPAHLKLEVEGVRRRLTLFAEHQLLRLVTEAASNAMQHAAPSHIWINLTYLPDRLLIRIRDDGCGFEPSEVERMGHFGVRGMYERANRLNGTLQLESRLGEGTTIVLSMPYDGFLEEGSL